MPLSSAQQAAVSSFREKTGVSDKEAKDFLVNAKYKLSRALEAYYKDKKESDQKKESQLNELFNYLQKNGEAEDGDTVDKLENSVPNYIEELGASLLDISSLIVMYIVQAPSAVEITRKGFVDGWKTRAVEPQVKAKNDEDSEGRNSHRNSQTEYWTKLREQDPAGRKSQAGHLAKLKGEIESCKSLAEKNELFEAVYRHAFGLAKQPGQRALSQETAVDFWNILFKTPGQEWVLPTSKTNLFEEWKLFLMTQPYSVNRDMWNMTLKFARKCVEMDDDELKFYDPVDTWPTGIDDFVTWYQARRGRTAGTAMDVDT